MDNGTLALHILEYAGIGLGVLFIAVLLAFTALAILAAGMSDAE